MSEEKESRMTPYLGFKQLDVRKYNLPRVGNDKRGA